MYYMYKMDGQMEDGLISFLMCFFEVLIILLKTTQELF